MNEAQGLAGTDALVLAGGRGLRLRSVVPDKPKVVARVGERPFVSYVLDQLAAAHVAKAVLCTGHLAEAVAAELGSSHHGLPLEYSPETSPLGTGGAVRLALPRIRSADALVLNGDSYCRVDFAALLGEHRARRARITIAVAEVADTRRFGRVDLDASGAVRRFVEKDAAEGSGFVNAGVYAISREAIESIPAGKPVSLEREVFPSFIGRGLFAHLAAGPLWDIGVPADYLRAQTQFCPAEELA